MKTLATATLLSSFLSKITVTSVSVCLLLFLSVCVLYQIIYYRFFHPLSKFPGPFWASVTRLWGAYHSIAADEVAVYRDLSAKYGTVVRVSPSLLLVNDPARLSEIYHRQANKSRHYITGSFGLVESVFNMQDWRTHAYHRKLIAGPYSFTNIKKMEPLIDARISHWIERLDVLFAATGKEFDFAPWAVFMAYDIISEVAFGAPFGFVESGTDVGGLIQGFHDALPIFGFMARLYPFTNFMKKTWLGKRYLVAKPEDQSGMGTLMRFRDKLLEKRMQDIEAGVTTGRTDFLQGFLDARTEGGAPLNTAYIKAEMLLILLAGADTTGTALQGFLYFILTHPSVYETLMAEIDAATRAGYLSPAMPQYHEVQRHCPYYIACMRETLRLRTPAYGTMPRVVSKGGMRFDGGLVAPEGTEVTAHSGPTHFNKEIFGDDAAEFRPDRWLVDEKVVAEYLRFSLSFGYGARVCLGKDLAMMELCKGGLQFLRTFRFEPVQDKPATAFVGQSGIAYWQNLWLTIERRSTVAGTGET